VGAGAKPGTIASQVEQATGLEREEYLLSLQGKKLFNLEPNPPKHFGTKQNPVVIYTQYGERQVGCQGAARPRSPPSRAPHILSWPLTTTTTTMTGGAQDRARTRRNLGSRCGGR
jgi:hypothetical protein